MMKMFVYGSLRKGYHNHDRFLTGCRYVGDGITNPEFTMITLGNFPGVFAGGDTAIKGEIYEVNLPTLRQLDRLEGHPDFYRRTAITLQDGMEVRIYLYQPPVSEPELNRFKIHSGDWNDRGAAKNRS